MIVKNKRLAKEPVRFSKFVDLVPYSKWLCNDWTKVMFHYLLWYIRINEICSRTNKMNVR